MKIPSSAKAQSPGNAPSTPRIAVIVPAYGVAHLVGEALESLRAQTIQDWECIVIDDGAPDDVAGAVEPFLSDERIHLMLTPNQGVSAARNTAIAATSSPLVALLDGDDLLRPTYLETMAAVMEAEPDARIATCNARIFGAVSEETLAMTRKQGTGDGVRGTLSDVLAREFNVYIGSTFRRADFDAIGGFDTSMSQSEDLDFWVRLMLLGGYARYVDEILGDYRVRRNSASANGQLMMLGMIRVYEKACEALGDRPEGALARDLLAMKREELAFEHAIDRIIDGDYRHGIRELRAARSRVKGPIWSAAFAVWQIIPSLAKPMLSARRRAHARGHGTGALAALRALLGLKDEKAA
ncbi:MAG: glycosyltransferase family 2 protein [Novosphingobium sp.]|nr:glycosyltransferase family 2 protein [Novosphingobium sp.]